MTKDGKYLASYPLICAFTAHFLLYADVRGKSLGAKEQSKAYWRRKPFVFSAAHVFTNWLSLLLGSARAASPFFFLMALSDMSSTSRYFSAALGVKKR